MLLLAAAAMLVTLVSVVESMLLSFGSVELIMSLGSGWSPQVQAGLTVVGLAFPLVMTLGASAGVPVGRATGAPSASNDFVVGGLLLTVGLVVSIGSFVLASSGSGGGPYVIATGAIAVGLLRLLRGGARAPRDEDPSRDR
jgi:hypothetical protein